MLSQIRPAIVILILFTIITGVLYPLAVTGIAQALFRDKANGSLIEKDGKVIGSKLIGQSFDDPKYFWGRLSGTGKILYDAGNSNGANFGPTNDALLVSVNGRIKALKEADPTNTARIPVDLVTNCASGLDPHISPAAAEYQMERVANARKMAVAKVRSLVAAHTEARDIGLFGEPRVNVLQLNLALDDATK
jgi:potassium-transporting ATPase KdpC subunit